MRALADVAAAADLEELDELAAGLGQARRTGKGVPDVLTEHERSLREAERNRLLGAASTVQPKLAGDPRRHLPADVHRADRRAPVPVDIGADLKGGRDAEKHSRLSPSRLDGIRATNAA